MKKPKYRNRKITVDGITFDSVREYNRWRELQLLERAGKIQKLQRQVEYILIPSQFAMIPDKKTGKQKRVCIERQCSYISDFVYLENDKLVVEDCKSPATRTPQYRIKKKLMLYTYGIQIKET